MVENCWLTVKESRRQLSLRRDDSRGVKEAVMFRIRTALLLFIKLSSTRPNEKRFSKDLKYSHIILFQSLDGNDFWINNIINIHLKKINFGSGHLFLFASKCKFNIYFLQCVKTNQTDKSLERIMDIYWLKVPNILGTKWRFLSVWR